MLVILFLMFFELLRIRAFSRGCEITSKKSNIWLDSYTPRVSLLHIFHLFSIILI